jgi:hypothetical protein
VSCRNISGMQSYDRLADEYARRIVNELQHLCGAEIYVAPASGRVKKLVLCREHAAHNLEGLS